MAKETTKSYVLCKRIRKSKGGRSPDFNVFQRVLAVIFDITDGERDAILKAERDALNVIATDEALNVEMVEIGGEPTDGKHPVTSRYDGFDGYKTGVIERRKAEQETEAKRLVKHKLSPDVLKTLGGMSAEALAALVATASKEAATEAAPAETA
jgi:hypothetical protein|tara:strand:+ start:1640 stop:2101 length:462 start_codon:yes stop_codon:yes gene_type:complete